MSVASSVGPLKSGWNWLRHFCPHKNVTLLLQIWECLLFNMSILLFWCAATTKPDSTGCRLLNVISTENVRRFPGEEIKVSSSGMFWFISPSAEANGSLYAILIRKGSQGNRKSSVGRLGNNKMLGWVVLYVCMWVYCVCMYVCAYIMYVHSMHTLIKTCSVKGIKMDILFIIFFPPWTIVQFYNGRGSLPRNARQGELQRNHSFICGSRSKVTSEESKQL